MRRRKLTLAGLAPALVLAAALGGCDDYGDDYGGGYTPPPPMRIEDQFGTNFGKAFRAAANAAPIDPMAGDIVASSLTTDPVDIPDPSGGQY